MGATWIDYGVYWPPKPLTDKAADCVEAMKPGVLSDSEHRLRNYLLWRRHERLTCNPSNAEIADSLGWSRRKVTRVARSMAKKGFLFVWNPKREMPSEYQLFDSRAELNAFLTAELAKG